MRYGLYLSMKGIACALAEGKMLTEAEQCFVKHVVKDEEYCELLRRQAEEFPNRVLSKDPVFIQDFVILYVDTIFEKLKDILKLERLVDCSSVFLSGGAIRGYSSKVYREKRMPYTHVGYVHKVDAEGVLLVLRTLLKLRKGKDPRVISAFESLRAVSV